jgi:hypothetical protein
MILCGIFGISDARENTMIWKNTPESISATGGKYY